MGHRPWGKWEGGPSIWGSPGADAGCWAVVVIGRLYFLFAFDCVDCYATLGADRQNPRLGKE